MPPETVIPTSAAPARHRIELKLRDVNQLFNTMDPSPFRDKDLDRDAEEFIESWAREFPAGAPVALLIHLSEPPSAGMPQIIEVAIHNHFANRARLNGQEFRQLMAQGWRSLLIGLAFISVCLIAAAHFFPVTQTGTLAAVLRESLTIGGWVAMWRPLEIYLYDWWPITRRGRILRKLAQMPVEVRAATESPTKP